MISWHSATAIGSMPLKGSSKSMNIGFVTSALVISTPVSIVCGLTRAAREGILFKGGVYLEELGRIRNFFFDKTGTLTLGKPEVVAVQPFRGRSEQEVLRLAVAIESRSEHLLAEAILDVARSRGIQPPAATDVQAVPGMGVRGCVNGEICLVGNPSFFNGTSGIAGPDLEAVKEWERRGATVVVVGTGKEAFGMIAIQDAVRKEAADVLRELRSLGATELAMLTGDNPETGKAVASLLPMDAVHAGLLPEQKIALVREAVEKGKKVAMVGDGINDAPALAMATVGVVMGAAGTDVALEAGDVVLMGDGVRKLPVAVRLGRRTLRLIRFNVAFALGTKAVFLVLATAGMATLWMGVAADMGASLLVIGNGMRLLWGRTDPEDRIGGQGAVRPPAHPISVVPS